VCLQNHLFIYPFLSMIYVWSQQREYFLFLKKCKALCALLINFKISGHLIRLACPAFVLFAIKSCSRLWATVKAGGRIYFWSPSRPPPAALRSTIQIYILGFRFRFISLPLCIHIYRCTTRRDSCLMGIGHLPHSIFDLTQFCPSKLLIKSKIAYIKIIK